MAPPGGGGDPHCSPETDVLGAAERSGTKKATQVSPFSEVTFADAEFNNTSCACQNFVREGPLRNNSIGKALPKTENIIGATEYMDACMNLSRP